MSAQETREELTDDDNTARDNVGVGDNVTENDNVAGRDASIVADIAADTIADIDDKRLPLLTRIYGVVLIVQGLFAIPMIVIAFGYAIRTVVDGSAQLDRVSLSVILSWISAVLGSFTTVILMVFGVLLTLNKRRHAARWTYVLIPLTIAEGLFVLMLDGLSLNLVASIVQLAILVSLSVTVDPALRQERRLKVALWRMDERAAYEDAAAKGMPGRDLTGKGYIALDFFNLFWLFVVGCVFGLTIESIYHVALFHEWQDRAGLLWGPFSPIYGFGAVLLTVLLNRLWRSNWLLIFCASAVIGGTFEYLTSWVMEVAFGITAWDYTGQWLSIDGRTSGKYMFFWGLLGLAWIKLILPHLLAMIQRIPWKWRYSLTLVFLVFMLVDATMTVMAIDAWYSRLAGIADNSPIANFFGMHYGNDFMANRFQTMSIDPSKAGRM